MRGGGGSATLEGEADADLCPASGNTCSGKACIFYRLGKQAVVSSVGHPVSWAVGQSGRQR